MDPAERSKLESAALLLRRALCAHSEVTDSATEAQLAEYVRWRKLEGEDLAGLSREEVIEHRDDARDQVERVERRIWARQPWPNALAGLAGNLRAALTSKNSDSAQRHAARIVVTGERCPLSVKLRLESVATDASLLATVAEELGMQALEPSVDVHRELKEPNPNNDLLDLGDNETIKHGSFDVDYKVGTKGPKAVRRVKASSSAGRLLLGLVLNDQVPTGLEGKVLTQARGAVCQFFGKEALTGRGAKIKRGPAIQALVVSNKLKTYALENRLA